MSGPRAAGTTRDMVREAFVAAKAGGVDYVLDGLPRSLPQARATYHIALELGMTAHVALYLKADRDELRRLLLRAGVERLADDTEDAIRAHFFGRRRSRHSPVISLLTRPEA